MAMSPSTQFQDSAAKPRAKNNAIGAEQTILTQPESDELSYTHHHDLAKELAKSGRIEEAVEAERLSVQNHPDYFDSLFNMACLLSELHREEEALEIFHRALAVAGPHKKNVKAKITALIGPSPSKSPQDEEDGVNEDEAAREPLAYSCNEGGLTNQKFALLGLIADAYEAKRPILLPKWTINDHVAGTLTQIPMNQVFAPPPHF